MSVAFSGDDHHLVADDVGDSEEASRHAWLSPLSFQHTVRSYVATNSIILFNICVAYRTSTISAADVDGCGRSWSSVSLNDSNLEYTNDNTIRKGT